LLGKYWHLSITQLIEGRVMTMISVLFIVLAFNYLDFFVLHVLLGEDEIGHGPQILLGQYLRIRHDKNTTFARKYLR